MLEKTQVSKVAKICCVIFLFYVFWFKYSYSENKIILYGSVGIAAFSMCLDYISSDNASFHHIPWGVLVNLVMCAYSLITGIWVAKDINTLVSILKTYFFFSVMLIIIYYISQKEHGIDWVLKTLIGVCFVSAIYVIFKGKYWYGYGYTLSERHNPNALGVLMDIGIFCAIYRSKGRSEHILVYLGMIALFTYIIIGCGSRKCLIAAAILCFLAFSPLIRNLWATGNQIRRFIIVAFVIVVIYGVYYYFKNIYITSDSYQRMQGLGDSAEGSSAHRMLYYQYAWNYFKEHPLFGIGLNQFVVWNPFHQYSHSTYAEAIASWGVVGCFIYFSSALIVGIRLIRLLLKGKETYITRVLLALWATEIFLGIGQIWFYDETHLIVWTIISILIETLAADKKNINRGGKYVKG